MTVARLAGVCRVVAFVLLASILASDVHGARNAAASAGFVPARAGHEPIAHTAYAFVLGQAGESKVFDGIEFVWIPPGTFTMGSPLIEEGRSANEVAHPVTISHGFWLGKYEVTQAQWTRVMGHNPSYFKGESRPVEQVSWADTRAFMAKLNAGATGGLYRLPTEAEWEYACRAGTTGAYGFDTSQKSLGDYAWFAGNSDRVTHAVGQLGPNVWGLHDMHGNVWEWCEDWYGDYSGAGPVTDPAGPDSGVFRVLRGGSCSEVAVNCRAANRLGSLPDNRYYYFGFRVVRIP